MAKRKAAHEHHGGAWKVAYSDFITSMMALFMVLWILAQNIQVRESIAHYFLDPFSAEVQRSPGVVSEDSNYPKTTEVGIPPRPVIDHVFLFQMAQEFYKLLNLKIEDEDKPIEIDLTDDGVLITIFDRDDQPIFYPKSVEFTEWGKEVMKNVAWLIARLDMQIKISAHVPTPVDRKTDFPDLSYGPWELTTEMSNAVRRSLDYYALPDKQFNRVTGYGDSQPIQSLTPEHRKNQRIEIELVIPGSDTAKPYPTKVPLKEAMAAKEGKASGVSSKTPAANTESTAY